jgi:hypothetical protein
MTPFVRAVSSALVILSLTISTSPIYARDYVSGDGHEYSISCNSNGFSLKSRLPVTRFLENGAASRSIRLRNEVIFFGKSCDAFNKVFGSGTWCQANGGFSASLEGHDYFFPRQEPFCGDDYVDYSCLCNNGQ